MNLTSLTLDILLDLCKRLSLSSEYDDININGNYSLENNIYKNENGRSSIVFDATINGWTVSFTYFILFSTVLNNCYLRLMIEYVFQWPGICFSVIS